MKDNDSGRSPDGAGLSQAEPVPVSALRASIPSADVLHEILLAQLRSVFASAYAFRLRQGWTDAEMAERACWDVRTFRNLMLAPRRMSIRDVGLMAFAFDVELDFKLVPRASGIAARSDETAQQAQPEGQEPGPKGDAQTSSTGDDNV